MITNYKVIRLHHMLQCWLQGRRCSSAVRCLLRAFKASGSMRSWGRSDAGNTFPSLNNVRIDVCNGQEKVQLHL